jgi:hypothetical protein
MLYDTIETDLYGLDSQGKLSDPVLYLLNREIIQDDREKVNTIVQGAISGTKKLDREIKSKYNLLKQMEPQFSGSGFLRPPNNGGFTKAPNSGFKFVR